MSGTARTCALLCSTLTAVAVTASPALAQRAFVANAGSASLTLFDTATNAPLGSIPVGGGPADVAITPDGTRAYVANSADDTVSVVDVGSAAVVATVAVGDEPQGLAITPDGSRVYVANAKGDSVSVVSTATNALLGLPIPVGTQPEGVAITPDGKTAVVAQRSGDLALIETATGAALGTVVDSLGPAKLAITPDGSRGFAVNRSSNSLTIFSLPSGIVLGSPVLAGANPRAVALSPGGLAYVASGSDNVVTAIDPVAHAKVGQAIHGFAEPAGIAATADGATAYVANAGGSSVAAIDVGAAAVSGAIPTGASPQAIAIVPDQPPHAFFLAARDAKQGQRVRFDATASSDPDGRVANYAWDFGDGQVESGPSPLVEHSYARPGDYRVSLLATDEQGCSTKLVFTGQTASCNGSAVAGSAAAVRAVDTTRPSFRLSAERRQALASTVVLLARCPKEDCRVTIAGTLEFTGAGRGRATHRSIDGARVSISAGGRAKLKLPLRKQLLAAARHGLAGGASAQLRIKAVARDAAGNRTTRVLRLRLLAPRKGNSNR